VKVEAVEAVKFCGSGSTLKKELETETNSEATNFIRSWKQKQKYSTAFTSLVIIYSIKFTYWWYKSLAFCYLLTHMPPSLPASHQSKCCLAQLESIMNKF